MKKIVDTMPSIEVFRSSNDNHGVDEISEQLKTTTIHCDPKSDLRPEGEETKKKSTDDLREIKKCEAIRKEKDDLLEEGKEAHEESDQSQESKELDSERKDEEAEITAEKKKNEDDDIKGNQKFNVGDECRKIWAKICPDADYERNKTLKATFSQMLRKAISSNRNAEKVKESVSEPRSLRASYEDTSDDDIEQLAARGPGQTNYQQSGYAQNFIPSPGHPQPMASPPHESMSMPVMMDVRNTGMQMDLYWDQNSDLNNPVSPPFGSYPRDTSCDYSVSSNSPQSISDDLTNIPTVIAKGMQVIVPGQLHPDQNVQELLSTWGEHTATRDFDEQVWPSDPSSPSSYQGNPPSVSSSDLDSVFNSPASSPYNPAMSPSSGSTGSAVHSPAAVPITNAQWCANNSPAATQYNNSTPDMTISTSNSMNFGHVQVRSSIGSSGCYSGAVEDKVASINRIKMELMNHEKSNQATSSLPPINNFLHRPPHRVHPYPPRQQSQPSFRGRQCELYQQPDNIIARKDVQLSDVTITHSEYQNSSIQAAPVQNDWYRRAQNMTREELLKRDRSDPYEGEDILQKLILHQYVEGSVAVINRMRSLNLSLDGTNDQKQSALLMAVINNMPLVVQHLVNCGVDVNAGDNKGTFPIHYAATHGFVAIIHAMCRGRPPVNLDRLDFKGKTPLMCAVEAHGTQQVFYEGATEVVHQVNNIEMVLTLMQYGAQPTTQDASSGKTALHYAIADMKYDMIKLILEEDRSLQVARVPMSDGNTPMHLAVALRCDQGMKCSIINYLVSKGADIAAQNVEKVKPTDLVTDGHTEVRNCLERYSRNRRR